MSKTYIQTFWRNVNGVIVVAECIDGGRSLDIASKWFPVIDNNVRTPEGHPVPYMLLINKSEEDLNMIFET